MIKSKIFDIYKEKGTLTEEQFFLFIKEKKLEAQLPSILNKLEYLLKNLDEKNKIQIEAPHALSEATVKDIKNFLQVPEMEEKVSLNKELIAGFRARYNGIIYDASFKTGLENLKKSIIK
jgi:F0F1-type ATP synthase delta subunit